MTRPISDFLPTVRRELTGCSDPLMEDAILRSCIEFCEKTHVWVETLDTLPSIENLDEYDIEPPDQSRVININSMYHNDQEIFPMTESELNRDNPTWREDTGTQADYYVQLSPVLFRPVPLITETADDVFKNIRAAVKPDRAATVVGDILFDDYEEAIGYGALAILFGIKNRPWTDLVARDDNRVLFRREIGRAKLRAQKGYTKKRLTMGRGLLPGMP
jgi:hypothetical protein